jgi:hypothetical protein
MRGSLLLRKNSAPYCLRSGYRGQRLERSKQWILIELLRYEWNKSVLFKPRNSSLRIHGLDSCFGYIWPHISFAQVIFNFSVLQLAPFTDITMIKKSSFRD